jgi:hypothetical protein
MSAAAFHFSDMRGARKTEDASERTSLNAQFPFWDLTGKNVAMSLFSRTAVRFATFNKHWAVKVILLKLQ